MTGHDHSHDHHSAVSDNNQSNVLLAFVLTAGFMLLEFAGGLWSGSLALIADAGHMLTDASALALAWLAFRIGKRQADHRRTFGYLRFEVLASLVNGLALFAIAIWISIEAWQRAQSPHEILTGPMLAIAVAGLLINLLVFRILTRGGDSDHLNVQGAVLHVLGDLMGSVAAIVAAVIIYFTGWTLADPLLSVLVAVLILRSAWVLVRRALHILLEGAPEAISPEMIEQHLLAQIPALEAVSHIHIWQITSGRTLATLHARPRDNTKAQAVTQAVEHELAHRFGIEHATVAVDWQEHQTDSCSLSEHHRHKKEHRH
ncbi:MAG TPA: cation diffusion facilitator family transporter [Pseudohongiella sp.]|nr:cation diffusion facilitator family transporter [Pseudohongiella sp.]